MNLPIDLPAGLASEEGALTREEPAPGLVVWQPRKGYRYGVEVYALAAFALAGGAVETALDLGCGSGVIGLLLASRGVRVRAVERDPRWLALARRNARESGVAVAVEEGDIRTWSGPAADLVVTNPPWFPADEPLSTDGWKAASRAMLHGDVADFVATGLRHAPRVCVVTRVERERSLAHFHVARRACLGARVVLLEVRPAAGLNSGPTVHESLDERAIYTVFGR